MLKRAGYEDVTVFERGERVGGVWNHNTYPGRGVRRARRTSTSSRSRRTRAGRGATRPRPRSRPTSRTSRAATACSTGSGRGTEVTSATLGRGAREVGARDQRRAARGRRAGHRLRPALGADASRRSRGSTASTGPAFHTAEWRHDVDLAGKRVAVVGTGCSAIQVVPAIQPIVAQLDVYQRSPGWTLPKMDFEYTRAHQAAVRALPASAAARPRGDLRASWSSARSGMTTQPLAAHGRSAPSARRQITAAIEDPELRAQGHADRRGRLQADDAHRRLVSDAHASRTSSWSTDRIAAGHADRRSAPRTAPSAPADVMVLATGFKSHGFVAPMEIAGAGGRTLAEEWAAVPARLPGHERARLPEHVPALRARTPTAAPARSSTRSRPAMQPRDRRAARARARRRRARIEVRREAAEAFDRELRAALAGSVWHTRLHQLVRRRARQRPEPVAVAVERLPPPHGADRARRLRAQRPVTRCAHAARQHLQSRIHLRRRRPGGFSLRTVPDRQAARCPADGHQRLRAAARPGPLSLSLRVRRRRVGHGARGPADGPHPEGERIEPFDLVFFPRGPEGAHQIRNDTDATVRVMMWSDVVYPAATVYPDSDKVGVWTGDKDDDVMVPRSAKVDYFHGET